MKYNYRHDARMALERARKELGSNDNERLKYAALELRMVIEAITYDRAQSYKDELPPEECATWQPKDVIEALLAVDPGANSDKVISVGKEEVFGEPAKEMHVLGTDKVLKLKVIKKHYNALGSALHIPTMQQLETGTATPPDKRRQRYENLVAELDAVLQPGVINSTIGVFSHIDCMRCEKPIRRRLPPNHLDLETKCRECGAEYIVRDKDGESVWIALTTPAPCPKCNRPLKLWRDKIQDGESLTCEHCQTLVKIGLSLYFDEPEQGAPDAPG